MSPTRWYWLFCDSVVDDRNWILYSFLDRVRLRDRYIDFQCKKCKKVDEVAALRSGIADNIELRSRYDLFRSQDDVLCASARVVEAFRKHRISGISRLSMPCGKYFVMLPQRRAEVTDCSSAGMRVFRPCESCGRPRELKGKPCRAQVTLPARSTQCAMLWPSLETTRGRSFSLIISELTRNVLVDARFRSPRIHFREVL